MENREEEEGNTSSEKKCLQWKKRTLMERYLILTCLALFIAFLAMIGLVTYWEYSHRHPAICRSTICYREAGQILSQMNFSAKPCEDFHNFACGSFIKYTVPDSDSGVYSTLTPNLEQLIKESLENEEDLDEPDFVRKVKLYYKSCLDAPTHIEQIIRRLLNITNLNVWPLRILQQGYVPTLEERLATATMLSTKNPYFIISPDLRGKSYDLWIYAGKFMFDSEVLLDNLDEENVKKKNKYINLLTHTLSTIGISPKNINLEITDLIEFETKLVKVSLQRDKNHTDSTLSKLEDLCPQFKWTKFWKRIYDNYGYSNDYNEETPVRIQSMSYIDGLCKLLEESDPRIVHDYLVWYMLMYYLGYFDSYFRGRLGEITTFHESMPKFSHRWKYCIYNVKRNVINPGLNYLMIKRMRGEKVIQEAIMYVDALRNAMDDMFSSENWLDSFSKAKAKKKLQSIVSVIGYTNISIDHDLLYKYFKEIEVTENYIENRLLEEKYKYRNRLFNETTEFSIFRKLSNPIWPDAIYIDDKIKISLGILTSPYLVVGAPSYLNYGGIGVVIAHELMHAFDQLDLENLDEIDEIRWPNNTIETFIEKRQCFIDQYSQYPIDTNGKMVDGFQTKRENIADNAGLLQSLKAYEKFLLQQGEEPGLPGLEFTNIQMFFIRYAQLSCDLTLNPNKYDDTHSPGKYRVIAPLQNLQQFSEAFNCPLGSPMNPKNKCRMWG